MRRIALILLPCIAAGLSGCIARTALDVVTAPVRVVGKAADLATTSQSEADENRGRDLRKREERLGKLERERDSLARKCADGNHQACRELDGVEAEMRALIPSIPAEPERH